MPHHPGSTWEGGYSHSQFYRWVFTDSEDVTEISSKLHRQQTAPPSLLWDGWKGRIATECCWVYFLETGETEQPENIWCSRENTKKGKNKWKGEEEGEGFKDIFLLHSICLPALTAYVCFAWKENRGARSHGRVCFWEDALNQGMLIARTNNPQR